MGNIREKNHFSVLVSIEQTERLTEEVTCQWVNLWNPTCVSICEHLKHHSVLDMGNGKKTLLIIWISKLSSLPKKEQN